MKTKNPNPVPVVALDVRELLMALKGLPPMGHWYVFIASPGIRDGADSIAVYDEDGKLHTTIRNKV